MIINMNKILNIHRGDDVRGAVAIYRPYPLGNPYVIDTDGDRNEVIAKYGLWLDARIAERDPVVCTALLGIRKDQSLACYCAPSRCHGEVIVAALESGKVASLRRDGSHFPRSFRYAGIGSRATPHSILAKMTLIAERLSLRGYTLLSGAAHGADSAFESGARNKEVFLPWAGFNKHSPDSAAPLPSPDAFRVAAVVHEAWNRLNDPSKALMARNSHQILGSDLKSPVDFVVCWTPDGCESESERRRETGGTGQLLCYYLDVRRPLLVL